MVLIPDVLTSLAIVVVALYTLVTAAERAVTSSLAVARRYEVPDVLIGMTILAFGTSLPELGSHVVASFGIVTGTLDYTVTSAVVVGGSVGSATVQQLLLVGLLLLGYGRIDMTDSFLRTSYLPMVGALSVTFILAWDGLLSRLDGAVLLGAYLVYAIYSYFARTRDVDVSDDASSSVRRDVLVAVGSLGLVLASATLLLWVIDSVVARLQLGGSMIGVLTIGIAAALPELSTVVDAIRRQTPDIAFGVLIGSNIVNSLVGLGLGGVLSTYYVPSSVLLWDFPFKLIVAVGLLTYVRLGPNRTLNRREGGYLVILYLTYLSGRLLVFTTT